MKNWTDPAAAGLVVELRVIVAGAVAGDAGDAESVVAVACVIGTTG